MYALSLGRILRITLSPRSPNAEAFMTVLLESYWREEYSGLVLFVLYSPRLELLHCRSAAHFELKKRLSTPILRQSFHLI